MVVKENVTATLWFPEVFLIVLLCFLWSFHGALTAEYYHTLYCIRIYDLKSF